MITPIDVERPILHPKDTWKWFGNAAHLIVGSHCRFHMATQVGDYLISTVGEWVPPESMWDYNAERKGITLKGKGDAREADYLRRVGFHEIGADRLYETMVFKAGEPCDAKECNCGIPTIDGHEFDMEPNNTKRDAQDSHMTLCHKWSRR